MKKKIIVELELKREMNENLSEEEIKEDIKNAEDQIGYQNDYVIKSIKVI